MNLTETPDFITWPETHYLYLEKIGSFQETAPQAWGALHSAVSQIAEHNQITGYTTLYKVEAKIYRAGVTLKAPAQNVPAGFQYLKFKGGRYQRFTLKGAFAELPAACGRVFAIVTEKKIQMRDDFCIENYVTDPRSTPEKENIIEILIPEADGRHGQ